MKTRRFILVAIATCLLTWLLALAGCSSQNSSQGKISQVVQTSGTSQLKVINPVLSLSENNNQSKILKL